MKVNIKLRHCIFLLLTLTADVMGSDLRFPLPDDARETTGFASLPMPSEHMLTRLGFQEPLSGDVEKVFHCFVLALNQFLVHGGMNSSDIQVNPRIFDEPPSSPHGPHLKLHIDSIPTVQVSRNWITRECPGCPSNRAPAVEKWSALATTSLLLLAILVLDMFDQPTTVVATPLNTEHVSTTWRLVYTVINGCYSILNVLSDFMVKVVTLLALSGPTILSILHDTALDLKTMRYLSLNAEKVHKQLRARLLLALLLGHFETKFTLERMMDPNPWYRNPGFNDIGQISNQLKVLLNSQRKFGPVIGAPIIFFVGSYLYELTATRQGGAYATEFRALFLGPWCIFILLVAAISGLSPSPDREIIDALQPMGDPIQLARQDFNFMAASKANMTVGSKQIFDHDYIQRPTAKTTSTGSSYKSKYIPVSLHNLGRNKWECLIAICSDFNQHISEISDGTENAGIQGADICIALNTSEWTILNLVALLFLWTPIFLSFIPLTVAFLTHLQPLSVFLVLLCYWSVQVMYIFIWCKKLARGDRTWSQTEINIMIASIACGLLLLHQLLHHPIHIWKSELIHWPWHQEDQILLSNLLRDIYVSSVLQRFFVLLGLLSILYIICFNFFAWKYRRAYERGFRAAIKLLDKDIYTTENIVKPSKLYRSSRIKKIRKMFVVHIADLRDSITNFDRRKMWEVTKSYITGQANVASDSLSIEQYALFARLHIDPQVTDRQRTDWDKVRAIWLEEMSERPPNFIDGTIRNFEVLPDVKMGSVYRLKLILERFSGQHWDWSPFGQPQRRLVEGKVRLQWVCSCGKLQQADVSNELAAKVTKLITRSPPRQGFNPSATVQGSVILPGPDPATQNAGDAASQNQKAQSGQFPGQSTPSQPPHRRSQSSSNTKARNTVASSKSTFILLCARTGSELPHTQITVKPETTDNDFVRDLRREYRKLRGWYYWLHPDRFYYCHYAKFIRWDVRRLAWECNELPSDKSYLFQPRPSSSRYKIPIRPDEWDCRYHRDCSHSNQDFLKYLPKRTTRFELDTWRKREEVWGLDVQYCTSAKVVLCWSIMFLLPSFVFLVLWLMNHISDLQNAAVPMTLSLSGVPVGYVVLGARYKGRIHGEL